MNTGAMLLGGLAMFATATGADLTGVQSDLVARYTLMQVRLVLSTAYSQYGGKQLFNGSATHDVDVYKVIYSTSNAGDSTPGAERGLYLSGLIMVPNRTDASFTTSAWIHDTTTVTQNVPSNAFDDCDDSTPSLNGSTSGDIAEAEEECCIPNANMGPEAVAGAFATAAMGYVAIVPDGIGYGHSSSVSPCFLIAEDYAIATIHLHAAARKLVPTLGGSNSVSSRMMVVGSGEGGYGALAVHRESYNVEWTEANVKIVASFPIGAYTNPTYEMDLFIPAEDEDEDKDKGNTKHRREVRMKRSNAAYTYPVYGFYLAYSYWKSGGVRSFFKENYAPMAENWFNGTHSTSEIDSYIYNNVGADFLNVLDPDAATTWRVRNGSYDMIWALDKNNLASWRTWAPKTSLIRLCYGYSDERVSPSHSSFLFNALNATPTAGDMEFQFYNMHQCTSHDDCAKICMLHTMGEIVAHGDKLQGQESSSSSGSFSMPSLMFFGIAAGVAVLALIIFSFVRRVDKGAQYESLV